MSSCLPIKVLFARLINAGSACDDDDAVSAPVGAHAKADCAYSCNLFVRRPMNALARPFIPNAREHSFADKEFAHKEEAVIPAPNKEEAVIPEAYHDEDKNVEENNDENKDDTWREQRRPCTKTPPTTDQVTLRRPKRIIDSRFEKGRCVRVVCCDECGNWYQGNAVGTFCDTVDMPAPELRRAAWERGDWDASWWCIECYADYLQCSEK